MKELNLTIPKATTKAYELIFKTDAGIYEDITGWTVYFTAKEKRADADIDAKISIKRDTHDNPTQGTTIITLTSANTDIDVNSYWYSVDYKDDDGNSGVLVTGKLKIEDAVRDVRD